jgi:Htaa
MKRTLCLGLLLCLCLVSYAKAEYDPIGSGQTKLSIDPSFKRFLAKNQISLKTKGKARAKGSSFTLPVSGGTLDPVSGKGEINSEGSLVFKGQRRQVPLKQITIKTKPSPLIAKVGGSQLKIASSKAISSKREGFGSSFQAKTLKLSAKVATRLNKKLRPASEFKEGQVLGSLQAKTQPQTITITEQGKATLVFEQAFVSKLDSRFVSLNPISPAERFGATFTFPIAKGGAIAPNGSEGTLRSAGSVELLQLGAGQLFWKDFWLELGARSDTAEVDIEPTPAFPGKLGRVGVFDLGATAFASEPKARTISTQGAPLTLNAQSAASLNEAFAEKQAVFAAGELVGTLSFGVVGE